MLCIIFEHLWRIAQIIETKWNISLEKANKN